MCGRPLGCKRRNENSDGRIDCDDGSVLCWGGSTAAGPDGVRDPNPNMNAASKACTPRGFSGSSLRPIVISFSSFPPASTRVQAVLGDCRPAVARVVATHIVWAIQLLNLGRGRVAVRSPEAHQDRGHMPPATLRL